MQGEKYSVTQYPISAILGFIEAGEFVIPEIQRPFVWKRSQVRDLIDSLYNGYPTGYLIIWKNPSVKTKDGGSSEGKKILIDGQQRVTALMAAISGKEVLDEDFNSGRIKIAFNPMEMESSKQFAVQDASHLKDKKWISDISVIFKPEFRNRAFEDAYILSNPEANVDAIDDALTQLKSIANRQIGVIELAHQLDIDEVTEIFIRINSQGKALSQSDFAMSKIAADEKYGGNMLRKAVDYFCHLAVKPEFYSHIEKDSLFMESEYAAKIKWLRNDKESIYDPDYGDMLRVSFMHQFGRGKLGDLVSLLAGRNFATRDYKEAIAEESFVKLKNGVLNFVNEFNFSNFVLAIKGAGFISEKLLNSQMTLDFAYTLYLLLSLGSEIPKNQVKRCIQKWFVMSTLTGRYIGSPETVMDRDLRNIAEKGFAAYFNEIEAAVLSESFWHIGLVQNLETSSTNTPAYNTFIASQVFNGDNSLFMNGTKVADLVLVMGDVHHIFPRNYLKSNGIKEKTKYNQIANYIYLDTQVNISIGDKAPCDYFQTAYAQCNGEKMKFGNITGTDTLSANLAQNCIPKNITDMGVEDYELFLTERRKLMAAKIETYYKAL
ncbi:DUF262 domain-containing protein [Oscillibacter sp.]|uniref:GmrSD restriction endonuclease domain-containing protein n=1 Tax=Oscillibacter sp. TaxID=1945593 RepID=UPI00289A27F8|nr:DUF262 domain-containing protein [Oscillibacter sp.]